MIKAWVDVAWMEYQYWILEKNMRKLKKINDLLKSIDREGALKGEGKPERLKYYDKTVYSRRIDEEHRLVYEIRKDHIYILKCKGHYE